jgi:hypothetical protein
MPKTEKNSLRCISNPTLEFYNTYAFRAGAASEELLKKIIFFHFLNPRLPFSGVIFFLCTFF